MLSWIVAGADWVNNAEVKAYAQKVCTLRVE